MGEKGLTRPLKARVAASRVQHMEMAFFDSAGLIYTHIVPKGKAVNAAYIVKVLGLFMKRMRKKRPQMVEQGFVFTGTTLQSTLLLSLPIGLPPGTSSGSSTRPFRRIWPPPTSSCSPW